MSKKHSEIVITKDGSQTIQITGGETYHSLNGAIQESQHVFIEMGFKVSDVHDHIHILEVGMGTGLNVLLTYLENNNEKFSIIYQALEPFPLNKEIYSQLSYGNLLKSDDTDLILNKIHESNFNDLIQLDGHFFFIKLQKQIEEFNSSLGFDLIYYDAFSPSAQPELWTLEIFNKLFSLMNKGGILTTYCAKGEVRRFMQEAGFTVERLDGAPGKREMLRAKKEL